MTSSSITKTKNLSSERKLELGTQNSNPSSLRLQVLSLLFCLTTITAEAKHSSTKKTSHHQIVAAQIISPHHHKHGHHLEEVAVIKTSRGSRNTHKLTQSGHLQNTTRIVRDRHGRVIKTEHVISTVSWPMQHSRYIPLQKEERSINAKEKVEPQTPVEAQELPSEYHDFQKAYALYDEGTNARLSGNYSTAITNISRALSMVPSNAHGGPSVLVLNMEYDLAQAAEASGDFPLAARYYARAIADRPNFPEANVHLVKVLAQSGKVEESLKAARDGVLRNPYDARAHAILAVVLGKTGADSEASVERKKATALVASGNQRSYVQPTAGSAPSFKSNTNQNSVGSFGNLEGADGASSGNTTMDSESEGFSP